MQLHRIRSIDVGIVEEELLLERQHLRILDPLLVQCLQSFGVVSERARGQRGAVSAKWQHNQQHCRTYLSSICPLVVVLQRELLWILNTHLLADDIDDLGDG
jgi:hypothetical protein